MPQGSFISRAGESQTHVYFPATSLFAIYTVSENQISTGMALIGNEGLGHHSVVLGMEEASNSYATVIGAGYGYRMTIKSFREELDKGSELRALALRFTNALMFQVTQSIVCGRHHSLQQRLCSWLLMCAERYPDNELPLTLGFIGDMLGARRTMMSLAIKCLQQEGAIRHRHGTLVMLNSKRLEEGACACYQAVRKEYGRINGNLILTHFAAK